MLNSLVAFFLLAFGISWGAGVIALVLHDAGFLSAPLRILDPLEGTLLLMALWGPSLAGIAMTYREAGLTGVKTLLARLTIIKIGWKWWAAAIVLPLAIQIAALFLARLFTYVELVQFGPESWRSAFRFFLVGLLFSPIGEEIGWRGYALPRLMQHMSALSAAILIGAIWVIWHAPVFLVPTLAGTTLPSGLSYSAFACMALGISILISWIYINGRSLLLPVIFHFLVLFQVTSIENDPPVPLVWMSVILFAAAALLVIGQTGRTLRHRFYRSHSA